jgi:hypothetical protein
MQTAGFRSMLTGETRAGSRALRQDSHLVSPDDLRFLPSDMYGYVLVPDGVDTKETAKDDVDLEEEAAASSSEEEEEWVAWPGPVRDDGLPYVAEGDDAASRLRLVVHPDVSLATTTPTITGVIFYTHGPFLPSSVPETLRRCDFKMLHYHKNTRDFFTLTSFFPGKVPS